MLHRRGVCALVCHMVPRLLRISSPLHASSKGMLGYFRYKTWNIPTGIQLARNGYIPWASCTSNDGNSCPGLLKPVMIVIAAPGFLKHSWWDVVNSWLEYSIFKANLCFVTFQVLTSVWYMCTHEVEFCRSTLLSFVGIVCKGALHTCILAVWFFKIVKVLACTNWFACSSTSCPRTAMTYFSLLATHFQVCPPDLKLHLSNSV